MTALLLPFPTRAAPLQGTPPARPAPRTRYSLHQKLGAEPLPTPGLDFTLHEDPESFAAQFATRWSRFLIEAFPTPAHAAVWSGRSVRTVENWLQGEVRSPDAIVVARALGDPGALGALARAHLYGYR